MTTKVPSKSRALTSFLKKLGTNEVEVVRNPHVFRFYRSTVRIDISSPTALKAAVSKILEIVSMPKAYKVAIDNLVVAARGEIDFASMKNVPFDRPIGA